MYLPLDRVASTTEGVKMGTKHRIMIVDDHPIVREGLCSLLAAEPDAEVCGEAEDVDEALVQLELTDPDLVVIDISLKSSNGIRLLGEIRARRPDVKALVWSMYDEKLFAERALRAGAMGYINKRESMDHTVEAIRQVLRGEVYLSEPMTRQLLARVSKGKPMASDPVQTLSDRELEVFQMIGQGMSTQQIAHRLQLSPKTVEAHRERIKLKLDVRNAAELSRRAVEWALQGG